MSPVAMAERDPDGSVLGAWAGTLLVTGMVVLGACDRGCGQLSPSGNASRPAAPDTRGGKLGALPYLNFKPVQDSDRGRSGVVRRVAGQVTPGLNVWSSRPRHEAVLMDNRGDVVHRWRSDRGQPGASDRRWTALWPQVDLDGWHHVEPGPGGALYAVVPYGPVLRLSWRSEVSWAADVAAHHDLAVGPNGEVLALVARRLDLKISDVELPIVDNGVSLIDNNGQATRTVWLLDVLRRSPLTAPLIAEKLSWAVVHRQTGYVAFHAAALQDLGQDASKRRQGEAVYAAVLAGTFRGGELAGSRRAELLFMSLLPAMDPLHANTLELVTRRVPGVAEPGDWLLCFRELDLLAVVDPQARRVRWQWGPGVLERPHQPTFLDNGKMLVFDNGTRRLRSRVLEVAPATGEVTWRYGETADQLFFSPIRGGVQGLPTGHVLITDSERGRALEVTRDGEVVWEVFNPDLTTRDGQEVRAPIYRVTRLPAQRYADLLAR